MQNLRTQTAGGRWWPGPGAKRWVVVFLAVAGWLRVFGAGAALPWRDHLTRAEVLAAMGEPRGDTQVGAREFLDYDGNVRVELQNGVVNNITGPVPNALKPLADQTKAASAPATTTTAPPATAAPSVTKVPAATPAPAAITPTPTPAPAIATVPATAPTVATPSPAPPAKTVVSTAPPAKPAVQPSPSTAPAVASVDVASGGSGTDTEGALVDQVAHPTLPPGTLQQLAGAAAPGIPGTGSLPGLGALTGMGGTAPGAKSGPPPPPPTLVHKLISFGIGLGVSTLFMAFVLKLAFHLKDFPITWRELAAVAFSTALFYQILSILLAMNDYLIFIHWLQADQIAAGLLMLVLIFKFTEVKQLPTAVGIMLSAMTVNIVLSYALSLISF